MRSVHSRFGLCVIAKMDKHTNTKMSADEATVERVRVGSHWWGTLLLFVEFFRRIMYIYVYCNEGNRLLRAVASVT